MNGQLPLFLPGWDVEPCDTPTPSPEWGGRGNPHDNVPYDVPRAYRRTQTVEIKGDLL